MSYQSTTPEGNNILTLTRIRNRLVYLSADLAYILSRLVKAVKLTFDRTLTYYGLVHGFCFRHKISSYSCSASPGIGGAFIVGSGLAEFG